MDLGPMPTNAAFFCVTSGGAWILNNRRSTDQGKTWQPCEQMGEAFCQLRDGTIIAVPGVDNDVGAVHFANPLNGKSTLHVQVSRDHDRKNA